jgi:hypothetical protein
MESAHEKHHIEVLDAAVQHIFPTGLVKSTTGHKGSETVFTGDRSLVDMQHAYLSSVGGFKILHWRPSSLFVASKTTSKGKLKHSASPGSPRMDCKTLLAAAPQLP